MAQMTALNRLTFFTLIQNVALTLLLFSAPAFAAEENQGEALFIETTPAEQTGIQPLSEDLKITVHDSVSWPFPEPLTGQEDLIKSIQNKIGQNIDKNEKGLAFPFAPSKIEKLASLNDLSASEIELFMSRRQIILEKFAKTLKFMRVKTSVLNSAMIMFNDKLYASSNIIAKANSYGGTAMFTINGGLALPEKLMNRVKQTKWGKLIPERGGFYYVLGLGAGISRTNENGKSRLSLELFLDLERLNRSFSGIIEAGVAGTYAFVYEVREGKTPVQQANVNYTGVLGVFRDGPKQFGWGASSGFSVPPLIGAVLFYEDKVDRYYLLRINRDGLSSPGFQHAKNVVIGLVRQQLGLVTKFCRALLPKNRRKN